MPSLLLHRFEEPWISSDPALFHAVLDPLAVEGTSSLLLTASAGAAGSAATFTPASPLDLTDYDELRLWTFADSDADGSPARPFRFELSYADQADSPGEQHRWLVPTVSRTWQQHRFGINADRRSAVTEFTLRCRTDRPMRVRVDELLATAEQPLPDIEQALIDLLSAPIDLLGGAGSISVPVVVEEPPRMPPADPSSLPDPVILLALTDQREEPERGWNIPQRDSFRQRGELTVCSLRPPARPVLLEYQILPAAGDRQTSLIIRQALLARLGGDTGLRVNGTPLPVRTLLPPPLSERDRAVFAGIHIHIAARVELGPRIEVPWVRTATVSSGQLSAAEPPEGIVLRL